MENSVDIHKRISRIRRELDLTQKQFAEELSVSQAYISSLEKGKREVSANIVRSLMRQYKISSDWLMTGEGSMTIGNEATTRAPSEVTATSPQRLPATVQNVDYVTGNREKVLEVTVNEQHEPNIVLVPVKAQAGYAANRVEREYLQDLPAFQLPINHFRNGTFRAFEVSGDSMQPTMYNNDIVVCRYVSDWRWIRDHELYVVVMPEDVLVKRVRNEILTRERITLISDNSFYPPMNVPATEVREIWQVFARITLHLPSPTHS